MKRNKGFTLIELLAVIVILGILLSISTVAVNTLRKKQEVKNKENVISSILTGAKEYNAKEKRIKVGESVRVNVLKSGDYVDFDEKKYSELMNNTMIVNKTQCENPLKIKYSITVDGKTYNDCGCEAQPNSELSTKSSELCTE